MNNEPVAWIDPRELDMAVSTSVTKHKQFDTDIPLYTHPNEHDLGIAEAIGFDKGYATAQAKTLTDEEIHNLFLSFCNVGFMQVDEIGFARAILRKAQEK